MMQYHYHPDDWKDVPDEGFWERNRGTLEKDYPLNSQTMDSFHDAVIALEKQTGNRFFFACFNRGEAGIVYRYDHMITPREFAEYQKAMLLFLPIPGVQKGLPLSVLPSLHDFRRRPNEVAPKRTIMPVLKTALGIIR